MSWTVKEKATTAGRYFLLFIFVSFLGWLGETIGCSIDIGAYCDRGFANMPLCTIYGFTVLILYALLGTPEKGGMILKTVRRRFFRIPLYFVLGMVITTALEFAVGWFFADVLGQALGLFLLPGSFSRAYLSALFHPLGNTHSVGNEIYVWTAKAKDRRNAGQPPSLDIRCICFAFADRLGGELFADIVLTHFHQIISGAYDNSESHRG